MKAYAVSDSFNGTLSAKSGYETDYKEPIYIYLPKSADAPQVAVNYVEEQKKSASMYDSSKLDERDQYSVFFGGNHAMIDIQSTQTEKRRLLVFKDSYANCFLPLLAPYYREIVVIDPRYYTGKLSSVMSDKQFMMCCSYIMPIHSLKIGCWRGYWMRINRRKTWQIK